MFQSLVFALVTFLHDLFTAIWVGGLITLGVAVLPSAKQILGLGPQTRDLMAMIQRRLSPLVYVSMLGLVATGMLLGKRSPAFEGLFRFDTSYAVVMSIKHILVAAMIVVALVRSIVLRQPIANSRRDKVKMALLFANIGFGIVVLFCSGLSAAMGAVPMG